MTDDLAGGIGFEAGDTFIQTGTLGNEVQVVFQDDVIVQFQPGLPSLELPAVQSVGHVAAIRLHGCRR